MRIMRISSAVLGVFPPNWRSSRAFNRPSTLLRTVWRRLTSSSRKPILNLVGACADLRRGAGTMDSTSKLIEVEDGWDSRGQGSSNEQVLKD